MNKLDLVDTSDITCQEQDDVLFITLNKTLDKGDCIKVDLLPVKQDMNFSRSGIKIGFNYADGKPMETGDIVRYAGAAWRIGWYAMIAGFTLISVYETENDDYIASSGVPIRDFKWITSKNNIGCYAQGYNLITREVEPIELIRKFQPLSEERGGREGVKDMKWLKNLFKVKKHRHYFSKTAASWEEGYRWKICMGCLFKKKVIKEEAPRIEKILPLMMLNPNTKSSATCKRITLSPQEKEEVGEE